MAIARTIGLARPPRPQWLGNSAILSSYLRNGGPFKYIAR